MFYFSSGNIFITHSKETDECLGHPCNDEGIDDCEGSPKNKIISLYYKIGKSFWVSCGISSGAGNIVCNMLCYICIGNHVK
jgi:DnaJ-class molecular chaperone